MKNHDPIESVGHNDFVDPEDASFETRTIHRSTEKVSPCDHAGERGAGAEKKSLSPEFVVSESGRLGWRVRIPGGRPLATPAVASGRVFVGGGFGSHNFYALDAECGELAWQIHTGDDGPTAATVHEGRVAFNTESCTVYVADARSGKVLWERWLGDPLMAQTAIADSTLFMVYPDRQHRHQLAAFDLEKGTPRWSAEIVADAITAPVVADDSVYTASLDGMVYRTERESGRHVWSAKHGATSAPWIHRGKLYMSLREEDSDSRGERFSTEGFDTVTLVGGVRPPRKASSRRKAEYLKYKAAKQQAAYGAQDAGVGFASAPSSAKLHMAAEHLGLRHVASLWAFQGSRPEVFDDGIFGVLDDVAQRLELGSKKPLWRVHLETNGEEQATRALSPPAVSAGRLYYASSFGDVYVLDRDTGKTLWSVNVGSPICSQPALAGGKLFVGTYDGWLYALETGDTDPRPWAMWGGGPGHNGPA